MGFYISIALWFDSFELNLEFIYFLPPFLAWIETASAVHTTYVKELFFTDFHLDTVIDTTFE